MVGLSRQTTSLIRIISVATGTQLLCCALIKHFGCVCLYVCVCVCASKDLTSLLPPSHQIQASGEVSSSWPLRSTTRHHSKATHTHTHTHPKTLCTHMRTWILTKIGSEVRRMQTPAHKHPPALILTSHTDRELRWKEKCKRLTQKSG